MYDSAKPRFCEACSVKEAVTHASYSQPGDTIGASTKLLHSCDLEGMPQEACHLARVAGK